MENELNIEEVCKLAIDFYGEKRQVVKCVEELGELIQAVAKLSDSVIVNEEKWSSNEHGCLRERVLEEMADVILTIFQLSMILEVDDEIDAFIKEKAERLHRRIQNATNA